MEAPTHHPTQLGDPKGRQEWEGAGPGPSTTLSRQTEEA